MKNDIKCPAEIKKCPSGQHIRLDGKEPKCNCGKKEIKEKIEKILIDFEYNSRFQKKMAELKEIKNNVLVQILELLSQEKQKERNACIKEHSFKCCQILREEKKKWVKEIEKKIKARLDYCQKQNGLPYCKNCGLNEEDLNKSM